MKNTRAQKIANRFKNDGQLFTDPRTGKLDIDDVCKLYAQHRDRGHGSDQGSMQYTFQDGSCITVTAEAWGIGYADCFCWQDAGHTDACKGYLDVA